jgi:hypothetical protein
VASKAVPEWLLGQAAVAERRRPRRQLSTDPADFAVAYPGVGAEGLDQIVDPAGAGAMQVRLHDHREQRLIDPSTSFEEARKEQFGAQLRIRGCRSRLWW